MRYPAPSLRLETPHTRRIASPFIMFSLLTVSFLIAPGHALGDLFQNVGPTPYGDDLHSASVSPYPAIAVSTISSTPPGECAWINTGLAAFAAANPADGSGPSGQAWSFTWAGVAAEAKVEAGISILDYYPYVVQTPAVTAGNGQVFPKGDKGELGGAVFNLKYSPVAGAPNIPNLHWIQAYTGVRRGVDVPALLDNDPAHPYTAQSAMSPFYDSVYAAGRLAHGGGWFLDTPLINENEYEQDPVASIQFQVILAGDVQTLVDGVTRNAVTLYGGEWWGFVYSAVDTPEPSTFLVAILGGSGLFLFRRLAARGRAA